MSDQQVTPKFEVGPIPQSILDVKTDGDFVCDTVVTIAPELEGYDDVLLEEEQGIAYATGRDGWIWKVDLNAGTAEHFVDVPVMAAGLHRIPGEKTKVITTNSRGPGTYPESDKVGLYSLDLATKEVTALVVRVPHSADVSSITSMLLISVLRCWIRRARPRIVVCVVYRTRSEPVRGLSFATSVTRLALGRSLNLERTVSGAVNTRWRNWFNVSIRCDRADLFATNRIRICSTGPFLVLGVTDADPDRAAMAAATASVVSDFPTRRRFWRF
jgi:hypothetical protein